MNSFILKQRINTELILVEINLPGFLVIRFYGVSVF